MRRVLLRATPAMLCLSVVRALAQQAISTPILMSDQNFRDLAGIAAQYGGTGYADTTSNNGVMRTGVFYRSAALTLDSADLAAISTLHIGLDVDLRTPSEINLAPDVIPSGATYVIVNIYSTAAPPPAPSTSSAAASVAYVVDQYQQFVTDPNQRAAYRSVLIDLANASDAAVFNCSAGKDRTGWAAVILQSIAGVAPATIMNDYLASNLYSAANINSTLAMARAQAGGGTAGDQAVAALAPLLQVQPGYLQAGLNQVIASYGSMNAYLIDGLGLTQADIYVLRAKMVDYLTLPGQSTLVGNAAAGAALLNALQNSPLSGHYTAYNYYLQSAVDAGTLGGVETKIGGQLHADAASYLLLQPVWIDAAIAPYADGRDLGEGQKRIWLAGIGGYLGTEGGAGVANSYARSAGEVVGVTYRVDPRSSVWLGIGGDWGSVGSAGANATVNTVLAAIGGRYSFAGLQAGPYVAARANAGWVDYQSQRPLGGGLGTAKGNTTGDVFGVQVALGDVIPLAQFTVTPQAGVRVSHAALNGFNESGSELALNVDGITHTSSDLVAGLDVALGPRRFDDWIISPAVSFGYEQALDNPQIKSTGRIYDYAVQQYSAYHSHYLMKAGLGVGAQREAFTVKAEVNALHGDGSSGINGQLSIAYRF
jgi:protein-tyrosine phosphatase